MLVNLLFLTLAYTPLSSIISKELLDHEAINVATSVIITVVTLVCSIEFFTKQLFFSRGLIRYFSNTHRNIVVIIVFALYGLTFCFNIDIYGRFVILLIVSGSAFVYILFFAHDIIKTDLNSLIKKLIKAIAEQIKTNGDFKCNESKKLFNILKDALNQQELVFIETIFKCTPLVIDTFLINKYKNESKDTCNSESALEFVKEVCVVCKMYRKDGDSANINRHIAMLYAYAFEKLIQYDSPSLIKSACDDARRLFKGVFEKDEFFDFFVCVMLEDSCPEEELFKRITICYTIATLFADDLIFECSELISEITILLKSEKIKIKNDNDFNLLASIIKSYMSREKYDLLGASFFLFFFWEKLEKKYHEKYYSLIGFGFKESLPFSANNLAVVNTVISRILSECEIEQKPELLIVGAENITGGIASIDKKGLIQPLELTKTSFENAFGQLEEMYCRIARDGNVHMVSHYFEKLNEFAASLNAADEGLVKKILTIYDKSFIGLAYSESRDRIIRLLYYYKHLIKVLDEQYEIGDKLGEYIVVDFIDLVKELMKKNSKYTDIVFQTINLYGGYDNTYKFIYQSERGKKYKNICEKVKNIAILAEEYQDYETLKTASGFIGWSLYKLLNENINDYKYVCEECALGLFRTLIKLKCDEKIICFVGTLFVINLAFCLLQKEKDQRQIFATEIIEGFTNHERNILMKSILLRKYEHCWVNMNKQQFDNGVNCLEEKLKENPSNSNKK